MRSTRDRVGAEFIGLARLFRQRVLAADVDYIANVRHLTAPIEQRLARKPILSPRQCLDTVRAWRLMSPTFRIALDAAVGARRALTICEWRIAGTTARNDLWDNPAWEPGCALVKVVVSTADGVFDMHTSPHSILSLHALARWFERSGKRDDDSLLRDLVPLLTTNSDRVACSGGVWLANTIVANAHGRNYRLRDVRPISPPTIRWSRWLPHMASRHDFCVSFGHAGLGGGSDCIAMRALRERWVVFAREPVRAESAPSILWLFRSRSPR